MSKNLLSLLLAVASFAVYYLLINPLYTGAGSVWQPEYSVESLQSLNKEYDVTLEQVNGLKAQANTLRTDYEKITDDQKQKMKLMVPDSVDKVRLLDEVSTMMQEAGFASQSLNVAESGGQIPGYNISFNVKSNYDDFKSLMEVFEKSLRLYSVQSVNFSTPDTGLTTYSVVLSTYYLKK